QDAIGDFDAAIAIAPEFWDAYIDRGLAWVRKGQYDRAIADFTEGSHSTENAYLALNNRANVYALQSKNGDALEDYSRAIELNPHYSDGYKNRGDTYNELGAPEKAIADFDAAIWLRPDFVDAYAKRGALYLARGAISMQSS